MAEGEREDEREGSKGRPAPHPGELEALVDDMEARVEREREEQDVEGSATDRHRQAPVDSGDDAPE